MSTPIDIDELRRWLELSRDQHQRWGRGDDYYNGSYRAFCDVLEHLDLMAEGLVRKMPRD